jgi:Icc-related predicted phosphoesterase
VWVERNFEEAKEIANKECPGVFFIGDGETIDIEGVKIFASAVTPYFCNWAWNKHPGSDIQSEWDKIQPGTDIVATHAPSYGILDLCRDGHVGCPQLGRKLEEIRPKYHFHGHIHEGYGFEYVSRYNTTVYNASICDGMYIPNNSPIELIY